MDWYGPGEEGNRVAVAKLVLVRHRHPGAERHRHCSAVHSHGKRKKEDVLWFALKNAEADLDAFEELYVHDPFGWRRGVRLHQGAGSREIRRPLQGYDPETAGQS